MSNSAVFCWSGGKDSAYCLHKVLSQNKYEIKYLLTTLNGKYNRVSLHGVREELLEKQADSIGIPLIKIKLEGETNQEYEEKITEALLKLKSESINNVIFGDIFLEDLRNYRENNLTSIGMNAVFPIWKEDTTFIIEDFIKNGFKSILCCVNEKYLGENWCGRIIDASFLNDLPENVDSCGENGEYHTFCFEGPIFKKRIPITIGKKHYYSFLDDRNRDEGKYAFWFLDIY